MSKNNFNVLSMPTKGRFNNYIDMFAEIIHVNVHFLHLMPAHIITEKYMIYLYVKKKIEATIKNKNKKQL